MNKRILFFTLLFVCFVKVAVGQSSMAPNAVSPELRSTGAIPSGQGAANINNVFSPNLYNGTVDVRIPIYDFSVDDINLGVSLGCNTGGIRVNDVASNVGLGWNLSTGGIITREVHGIEDELKMPQIDTAGAAASGVVWGNWWWVPSGEQTDPPDDFTAIIGGRTIKFQINNHQGYAPNDTFHFLITPHKNILVDLTVNGTSIRDFAASLWNGRLHDVMTVTGTDDAKILRIKITDERGNQFFFDRGDYENRLFRYKWFTNPVVTSTGTAHVAINWVLSKVITYSGATISYTYETDFVTYPGSRDQRVRERSGFNLNILPPPFPLPAYNQPGRIDIINDPINFEKFEKRIKQISYSNGDVVYFNTDGNVRKDIPGSKAITEIKIEKGYDAVVKNSITYKFTYAYFSSHPSDSLELSYPTNTGHSPTTNQRLKLRKIDKIGRDNVFTENYYSFKYCDIYDDPTAQRLPARLSFGTTDFWGFFNASWASTVSVVTTPASASMGSGPYSSLAVDLGQINVPYHQFKFTDKDGVVVDCWYGYNMSPNWVYAQTGLIKTIKNSFNGSVTFTYGPHVLSDPPDITSATNTGYFSHSDMIDYNNGVYHAPYDISVNLSNDGVCIKEILSSDGINSDNDLKKTFDYADGQRFFALGYFMYPTITNYKFDNGSPGYWSHAYNFPLRHVERIYQNTLVNPIDYVNGSNHGYSTVTVNTFGYAGELVGKTKSEFTNLISQPDEAVQFTDYPGRSRLQVPCGMLKHALDRYWFQKQYLGLLKKESSYSPTGTLLSQTQNSYNELRYADSSEWETGYSYGFFSDTSYTGTGTTYLPTVQNLFTWDYRSTPNSVVQLTSSLNQTFSGSTSMSTYKNYIYDGDGDIATISYVNSKGQSVAEHNFYTTINCLVNYNYPSGPTFPESNEKVFKAKWLTGRDKTILIGGSTYYTEYLKNYISYSPAIRSYDGLGNIVTPVTYPSTAPFGFQGCSNSITLTSPLSNMRFTNMSVLKSSVPVLTSVSTIPTYSVKENTKYDDRNNVLEVRSFNGQNFSSIWDTRIGERLAEVSNALYDDIAYTSFEGNFAPLSSPDFNKGNWDFSPGNVVLATAANPAITGRYYYDMGAGGALTKNVLTAAKKYLISFWYKGALPTLLMGGFTAGTLTNQASASGWTLATGIVTGNGADRLQIASSGMGNYIDELRLHPVEASMTSYTYEPLIGVSSSNNAMNNITYNEYDAMGRLIRVRDINKNIISLTTHTVQGAD